MLEIYFNYLNSIVLRFKDIIDQRDFSEKLLRKRH